MYHRGIPILLLFRPRPDLPRCRCFAHAFSSARLSRSPHSPRVSVPSWSMIIHLESSPGAFLIFSRNFSRSTRRFVYGFSRKRQICTRDCCFVFSFFFFFFLRPRNNYSDFRGNFFAVWKYRVCLTEHVFLDGSIFKKLIRFHCLYRR